jgi:hypothetical protein
MGNSAVFDTVAAIGFAGDHGRPQHTFGSIIGCLQPIYVQETQQMRAVFAQTFGKTGIIGITKAALGSGSKPPGPVRAG